MIIYQFLYVISKHLVDSGCFVFLFIQSGL